MESGLFMRTRQQDQAGCPEVTLNPDDQMDVMHKKCKEYQLPTESTDSFDGETVENHGEEPDPNFEEVMHQRWEVFQNEKDSHTDGKGRDQGLIFADFFLIKTGDLQSRQYDFNFLFNKMFDIQPNLLRDFTSTYFC